MIDYLGGLAGALGISNEAKRREIASDMEKILVTTDGEEREVLRGKLKEAVSPQGRFEMASGSSSDLMKAFENAISAMLLKEGRFFRSYAIVVAILSRAQASEDQAAEVNRAMRKLAGRFTNIMVRPLGVDAVEGYEVRLLSIGLPETDRAR